MQQAFAYAWHGSGKKWDAAPLQFIGGAIGGFAIWYWGLKVPPEILDNPAFSGIAAIAIGAICGALVAFVLRLCWWPVYRRYHPYGGLAAFLRAKLGDQMWPIILMTSGLVSFVALFGAGFILYVAKAKPIPDNRAEATLTIPYDVEEELRNIDELFDVVSTRVQDLGQRGQTIVNALPNHIQDGTADGFLRE